MTFESAASIRAALAECGYIASESIATTAYLAARLGKPILAEGPAGVGKTELAKALAAASGRPLVRLQCYEGLDESKALYEWKYSKQLLYTQLLRDRISDLVRDTDDLATAVERIGAQEDALFSERFLEPRPLLTALRSDVPTVLLIDEVDRAEQELEAFFLEVLAEFQVTVPELGTLTAQHTPLVVLTSNDTRDLSDALRRRCLFLPMAFPSPEVEAEIIRARIPGIDATLADAVARFVADIRALPLRKAPSIAETLDWARGLIALGITELDTDAIQDTLALLLKYQGDMAVVRNRDSGPG